MNTLVDKIFILQIFGTDSWTSFKDKQYEQVCEDILSAKDKIEAAWTLCREARSKKPVSEQLVCRTRVYYLLYINLISKNKSIIFAGISLHCHSRFIILLSLAWQHHE